MNSVYPGKPGLMGRPLWRWAGLCAIALAMVAEVMGQQAPKPGVAATVTARPARPRPTTTKWDLMDVGPFFSSGLEVGEGPARWRPALKGINIRLGTNNEAAVCFDTERLRMALAWKGGFLKLPVGRDGLEGVPRPVGVVQFSTPVVPGWASPEGRFDEPNPPQADGNELVSFGPLPSAWAKWRGLYRHGQRIILSYSVGNGEVLESPGYDPGSGVFTRQFDLQGLSSRATLLLASEPKAEIRVADAVARVSLGGETLLIAVDPGLGGKLVQGESGQVRLELPAGRTRRQFGVQFWRGASTEAEAKVAAMRAVRGGRENLRALTKAGPALWEPALVTQGKLGQDEGAYVVDTLSLPEDNPWKSWIRCSGFDFFRDGTRAALCSVSGDVWLVSGIDRDLNRLTWKRFATGLFQPLGLKIVDEAVYVLGRDQITRLRDLNGDGEADFYENFNNDVAISSHYHEFCLNLETDSKGNFYFTKGGNLGGAKHPHHGALIRVTKDGKRLEVVSRGLRAPNGLSVSPQDEFTTSDNEGNWVPSSRVNLSRPGGFDGHVFTAHMEVAPKTYDKPIFWLPHTYDLDNSSGGQVWVTSRRWGPFEGDLLHTSYGACALFKASIQRVGEEVQGAVWKFPLKFDSGVMRGRFNRKDGQLYLCGLVVWQSKGSKQGGFYRVRYTGKPVNAVDEVEVKRDGIELRFTDALDRTAATDKENFSLEQWNYKWTQNYGSPEFSVKDPERKGHDPLEIERLTLSPDGKTLFVAVKNLGPAMQTKLRLELRTAAGAPLSQEIYGTINRIP